MRIYENLLVEYLDGLMVRVVFHNPLSSIIYVVQMDKSKWPYVIEKEELRTLYEKGEIKVVNDDPFVVHIVEDLLSDAEKKRRDRAWEIVNYIHQQFENEEYLYHSKYRENVMKRAVDIFQVNYSTLKNYLLIYWQSGKVKTGMVPSFSRCGGRGKDRKESVKKRGRPRSNSPREGINVDEKIKRFFKVGLNRYYYNEKQNTLRTAYELTIKDFFTVETLDKDGLAVPIFQDSCKIPTYNQFLYWFKKFNDPKNEISTRKGSRIYHQKYKGIIGNSTQDAGLGPATLWQTDSTPLDVYCVSSINRNILVGKPLFHLVIDVYSHRICGFSLTFESLNSYSGAMLALLNSMTPKQEFCRKYGIEIDEDWDVDCIPTKIFTDRGELDGQQIESAIEGLGISIQNSPPYFPQAKGIVETMFAQIHARTRPHLDGAVVNGNRIRERGEQDFRLKANLSIDEVTAILIKCIIFYNNYHVIEDYPLSEEMTAEGVEKIPKQIWDFGVRHQKGQLRKLPPDVIRMHLLPNATATVTSKGVKFKKLLYASEYCLKENWFQTARIYGSWRVKAWYDPTNLSELYLANEENRGFHRLSLLDHLTKFRDKGIDEIGQILEHEKKIDSEGKEKELQEKMKLFNDIEMIVKEGERKTEEYQDDSISKSKKLKGIKENRKIERELQRERLKQVDVTSELIVDDVKVNGMNFNDDLDLFKRVREKSGGNEE